MFSYKFKSPKEVTIVANDSKSALRRYYMKTGAQHVIVAKEAKGNEYIFSIQPLEREDKNVIKVKCIGKNKLTSRRQDRRITKKTSSQKGGTNKLRNTKKSDTPEHGTEDAGSVDTKIVKTDVVDL